MGAKEETEQKSMPDAEIIWHKDRQRQHGSRSSYGRVWVSLWVAHSLTTEFTR